MNAVAEMQVHLGVANPTDCFELTVFEEHECWEMSREGIITYDEADHMAGGITLFEARVIIASYACSCDLCEAW